MHAASMQIHTFAHCDAIEFNILRELKKEAEKRRVEDESQKNGRIFEEAN
jgi:hypothetical protein